MRQLKIFSNFQKVVFSRKPFVPPGMGLGGHLVTILVIFQPTHGSPKTVNSWPVRPHRGADLGKTEIAPETPVIGWGSQKINLGGPWSPFSASLPP